MAFRHTSDSDNRDFMTRSPDKPFYIVRVAGENHPLPANGYRYHNGVNDIRGSRRAEQLSRLVGLALAKRNDNASSQEASELGLFR